VLARCRAIARLTRQSFTPFTQAPRHIAWREKPATYVVCTKDLATPADVQRRRVKENTRLVEFEAGHHPFLSRPDAFAASLAAAIDRD
jgi:pimeloyl-ACP methyl ester carboxylesterase